MSVSMVCDWGATHVEAPVVLRPVRPSATARLRRRPALALAFLATTLGGTVPSLAAAQGLGGAMQAPDPMADCTRFPAPDCHAAALAEALRAAATEVLRGPAAGETGSQDGADAEVRVVALLRHTAAEDIAALGLDTDALRAMAREGLRDAKRQ